MKLSIITINYNNAEGLRKTLSSVAAQTYCDIQHIIVDAASSDGSVEVIEEYVNANRSSVHPLTITWTSEKDKGIYDGMNKGIEIALGRRIVNLDHTSSNIGVPKETNESVSHGESGGTCHLSIKRSGIDHCDLVAERDNRSELVEDKCSEAARPKGTGVENNGKENESISDYIQILNSGDILAASDVTERMMIELDSLNAKRSSLNENAISILYGNMLKSYDGKKIIERDTCGSGMYTPSSFLYFYKGTLNHDCAYIRRDLFEKYGFYNEDMKICSDWEWYVRAIVLGGEKAVYTDIDVTIFDMNGISESGGKNKELIMKERREYLEKILPATVLYDYDQFSFPILQYQRLKKHHMWGLVYFIERVLFKLEKWRILK